MPRYTVQTERLLISEFDPGEQSRANLYGLTSNLEVMKYFPAPLSRSESDALLDRILSDLQKYGHCYNAVFTHSNEFAGIAGIVRQTLAGVEVNELAFRFLPQFQGQGLAREAGRALVDDALGRFNYSTLHCFVRPENKKARQLALACGFEYHQTELFKDIWHDIFVFQDTRSDHPTG